MIQTSISQSPDKRVDAQHLTPLIVNTKCVVTVSGFKKKTLDLDLQLLELLANILILIIQWPPILHVTMITNTQTQMIIFYM